MVNDVVKMYMEKLFTISPNTEASSNPMKQQV